MGVERERVAVVGAGPAGISALRYLRDEGFRVTLFEQRSDVGGLWCFDETPTFTSATAGTKLQISKYITPMTDYPYPEDFPTYLGAEELGAYYHSYAEHFKLYPDIQFNSRVVSVRRSQDEPGWLVRLASEKKPKLFDRVVWATGTETVPRSSDIRRMELFKGQLIHGQAYKKPEDYQDKRVVVLGFGNSAVDAAVELTHNASKVYLSHRRGAKVVPRMSNGRPIDSLFSWTFATMTAFLQWYLPALHAWMLATIFDKEIRKTWGPQYKSSSFNKDSGYVVLPRINDNFIPLVRAGAIISVPVIRTISGPHSVELDNGEVLEDIDTIIACTGYESDFSQLESAIELLPSPHSGPPIPKLYMNIFPPRHADSLACLNNVQFPNNAATVRELIAMAVAQTWSGKSPLPSVAAMEAQARAHQAWAVAEKAKHPDTPGGWLHPHKFLRWLHGAAGTGMFEHVGWFSWPAWKLWWADRKLYGMVARGVFSPHIYRLFDTGKRPAWKGARDAIIKVNEQLERDYPKNK